MREFKIHPEADLEAIEAASYIKSDDPIQGEYFKEALVNAINKARRDPFIYRTFDGEFRKVKVGKFTYAVVFRLKKDVVQILAVMHLHRRPGYWKDRSKNWPS